MNRKGQLYVLVGPSGSGKGTVLSALLQEEPGLFLSVSATTRGPRPGEIDGKSYYFYTKERFEAAIQEDEMLEYASYCGNYYGTPRKAVEEQLREGKDVILEIEMQGARQIKEKMPEAVLLFILPPSFEILRSRLIGRGTEPPEVVEKRLSTAVKELPFARQCDYVLVNDTVEHALRQAKAILTAQEHKTECMQEFLNSFTKEINDYDDAQTFHE